MRISAVLLLAVLATMASASAVHAGSSSDFPIDESGPSMGSEAAAGTSLRVVASKSSMALFKEESLMGLAEIDLASGETSVPLSVLLDGEMHEAEPSEDDLRRMSEQQTSSEDDEVPVDADAEASAPVDGNGRSLRGAERKLNIFLPDTRVTTSYAQSTQYPYRAVGKIPGCTATLVKYNLILTNAHCVTDSNGNLASDFLVAQVLRRVPQRRLREEQRVQQGHLEQLKRLCAHPPLDQHWLPGGLVRHQVDLGHELWPPSRADHLVPAHDLVQRGPLQQQRVLLKDVLVLRARPAVWQHSPRLRRDARFERLGHVHGRAQRPVRGGAQLWRVPRR